MTLRRHAAAWLVAAILVVTTHGPAAAMNDVAERYVRLVLAVGLHDADYVDAYYGPPEWRTVEDRRARRLAEIDAEASALLASSRLAVRRADADALKLLRRRYLTPQLESLRARLAMLRGERLTFDEESRALRRRGAAHTEARASKRRWDSSHAAAWQRRR